MNTKDNIRYSLVSLLDESGSTQTALADALNVSKSAVSNWVHGDNSIDMELVPRICEYFAVSIDDFLNGRTTAEQTEDDRRKTEMAAIFDAMPPEKQEQLLRIAKTL